MAKHSPDFDPQDSDFEQFARDYVEARPNIEKIRGASNQAGDDGLYRNTEKGVLVTIEAKFKREQDALPRKHIDNLNEAAFRNTEDYGAPSERWLFTTSGSLALGAKKLIKQIRRDGNIIEIFDFDRIREVAGDDSTDPDLATGLDACLAKKARRSKSG
jgi:hypothetical protein